VKIGVISDTHLREPTPELYALQDTVFADVSLILHAGDLTELAVLEAFPGKDVVAVHGNMCSFAVKRELPAEKVVEIGGFRIGLTHGWGNPFGVSKKVEGIFDSVDVIVYGHTHRPHNKVREGVLYFNPGAFHGGFPFFGKGSVGILTLEDPISGRIIKL
jgi:putative phosphoesterase